MPTVWEMFNLKGRVAIVTGGAGQLGSPICDALAEAGARVVVASRNLERCHAKAAELSAHYAEAMPVCVDVTVPSSVSAMVAAVIARFGTIDIMVNNAYSGLNCRFEDMTAEDFESVTRGALTSTFLCSQGVTPTMKHARRGSIINIASIYGIVSPDHRIYGRTGLNSSCSYGAAKAGVVQLTRWLATYLAPYGIRVNCISPGGVQAERFRGLVDYEDVFVTKYCDRTPLGRMGRQSDLKGVVVFLASDGSEYNTGINLPVDGGWTAW